MVRSIEFHGRLCRADNPPVSPGVYDLLFRLHPAPTSDTTLWEDEVRAIPVRSGGYYNVVLGNGNALDPQVFDGTARYLSVRVLGDGHGTDEAADRVPLLGLVVQMAARLSQMEGRLTALEAFRHAGDPVARRRTRLLRRRVFALEHGEGGLVALAAKVALLEGRLARMDGDGGRVRRIEDELEDLVGPDGDVIDLDARLCRLEGSTPPGAPDRLSVTERRLSDLEARLKRR